MDIYYWLNSGILPEFSLRFFSLQALISEPTTFRHIEGPPGIWLI